MNIHVKIIFIISLKDSTVKVKQYDTLSIIES